MADEAATLMSVSPSTAASSGRTWLLPVQPGVMERRLVLRWRDYEASRDPHRSADIADFREHVLSMVGLLRRLSLDEFRSAVQHIFFAALEAYAREDMEPLEDMVGGWLATAEVASNPRLAAALDEAMEEIEVRPSQWRAQTTPTSNTIRYMIRRAGYGDTVDVSLPM